MPPDTPAQQSTGWAPLIEAMLLEQRHAFGKAGWGIGPQKPVWLEHAPNVLALLCAARPDVAALLRESLPMSNAQSRTTEGQPTLCRTCGEPKAALNQRTLLCSGTQHGPHQTTADEAAFDRASDFISAVAESNWRAAYRAAFCRIAVERGIWTAEGALPWVESIEADAWAAAGHCPPAEVAAEDVDMCRKESA